jgi:hypothetical protein
MATINRNEGVTMARELRAFQKRLGQMQKRVRFIFLPGNSGFQGLSKTRQLGEIAQGLRFAESALEDVIRTIQPLYRLTEEEVAIDTATPSPISQLGLLP